MTADELSEQLSEDVSNQIDRETLREKLSRREAAQICREVASALRERANGLDTEAEADGE